MRWQVDGADAGNGEEVQLLLEAESSQQAESIARQQGVLVSGVGPVRELPDGSGEMDGDPSAELARAVAETAHAPAVSYAGLIDKIPDYTGLRIGAVALRIGAIVWYIIGLLTLLQFFWSLGSNLSLINGLARSIGISDILQMLSALMPLTVGVIFHVIAEGCAALRDIARNSFRA